MTAYCPLVELRQYTLRPGRRDTLIDLFDREFVESQEAFGSRVIGQFRDLDDPNRFVWLRGFGTMESRREALAAFYGSPAWQANRAAANATMVDSDNVLLLRPLGMAGGFELAGATRDSPAGERLIVVSIHYLTAGAGPAFAAFFDREMRSRIEAAGAPVIAAMATESAANTFPALPVREGEEVFVWVNRFTGLAAYDAFRARLAAGEDWREHAPPELLPQFMRRREVLRLSPTDRSLLR
jgi:hypothetical protein